jgi:hypothetical protein
MRIPFRIACLLSLGLLFCESPTPCRADLWGLSVDPYGTATPGTEFNYNKVFRFDNDGNKLANDIPAYSGGLVYPTGIAVGPDNNIYVSSEATGSILFFDGQSGAPLTSPQPGGSAGLFAALGTTAPAQLAFGPDGNLYVSEFFGTAVRVYDAHAGANFGQRLADAATGLSSAGGLAFASNGDLLVGDGFAMAQGQTAQIVRVHNGVQSTFGATNLGGVYAPSALMTLEDDSLLIVDLIANYVAHYDANGLPLTPFAAIEPLIAPPGSDFPSDIKLDPDGNIIISVLGATSPPDNRGALWRYDLDGHIIDPDNDMTPNEPIVSGIEPIGGIDWTTSLATLAGDYDGNGSVGPSDYARWRADFGKRVARGNGADGDANGVIDARDYVLWRKAAGQASGTNLDSNAVPEPAALVLLFGGLLVSCTARARRA